MKNIHILPTDKPSRLYIDEGFLKFNSNYISENGYFINQNIYITSDEEIKEGDWFLEKAGRQYPTQWNGIEKLNFHCKKIILTDNKDLIKDGVQAIDDEFLEWFVKNPSCEEVEVEEKEVFVGFIDANRKKPIYDDEYKIIIPKEDTKQETLEDIKSQAWIDFVTTNKDGEMYSFVEGFNSGYKLAKEQICNHSYILTDDMGHRVIKCSKCNDTQPI